MFELVRFWVANLSYRLVAMSAITFTTYQIWELYELAWLFAYLVTVNLVTFLIYFFDKLIAPIGQMPILKYLFNIRAPNSFLFWELSLLGGGIGAVYGIYLNDHKTSEEYRWKRLQLWFINWIVFAGLLFILWAAVVPFADLNALIGGIILTLMSTGEFITNSARFVTGY